jgi:hypothetical protein
MRKWLSVAALCLSLAGCTRHRGAKDDFPYTPLPYGPEDEFFEIFGKSLVNVPTWLVEFSLVLAFFAAYVWVQAGAPTKLR